MVITGVRATPVFVPMHHPLRWSFGVEPGLTRVIVEIVTDEGLVGLGESNGGRDLAAAVIECQPLFVGIDPLEVGRIAKRFAVYRLTSEQGARAVLLKMAGAAIEMACWDLVVDQRSPDSSRGRMGGHLEADKLATAVTEPGKEAVLPPPPPLRTRRDPFESSGSSTYYRSGCRAERGELYDGSAACGEERSAGLTTGDLP